jgi:lipid-A-disaccharide synthase-like uncharacterized protein
MKTYQFLGFITLWEQMGQWETLILFKHQFVVIILENQKRKVLSNNFYYMTVDNGHLGHSIMTHKPDESCPHEH